MLTISIFLVVQYESGQSGVFKSISGGTSQAVQLLRLRTSTARGMGSISGQGAKIPQPTWCGQKIKADSWALSDSH